MINDHLDGQMLVPSQFSINDLPGGVGVIEVGKQLKVIYLSQKLSRLMGLVDTKLQGEFELDASLLMHPSDLDLVRIAFANAKNNNSEIDLEIRPISKEAVNWVRIQGKFSHLHDGNPVYNILCSDISKAKGNSLLIVQQNNKLNLVLENSVSEMWEVNLQNKHISTLTKTILGGHDPLEFDDPVTFLSVNNYIPQDYLPALAYDFENLMKGESTESILKIRCKDDIFRYFKISYTLIKTQENIPYSAIGTFQEVDDEIEARLNLLGENIIFFAAFDVKSGKPILADRRARFLIGPALNIYAVYENELISYIHPKDLFLFDTIATCDLLREFCKNGKKELSFEARIKSPYNTFEGYHWCLFSFNFSNNVSRADSALFLGLKDIDAKKKQEIQLVKQANRDPLTGLLNRYSLIHLVETAIETTSPELPYTGFFIIDIDDFKKINDTFGHDFGDESLQYVATILKDEFESSKIIARIGGDELLVCLPSLETEAIAFEIGCSICKKVSQGHELIHPISCSVGVSIAPSHGKSYKDLYQKADIALYKAKHRGKNRCCVYDNEVNFSNAGLWINQEWMLEDLEQIVFLLDETGNEVLFLNKAGRVRIGKSEEYYDSYFDKLLSSSSLISNSKDVFNGNWIAFEMRTEKTDIAFRFKKKLILWKGKHAILGISLNREEEESFVQGIVCQKAILQNEEVLSFIELAGSYYWNLDLITNKVTFTKNFSETNNLGVLFNFPDGNQKAPLIHPDDFSIFVLFLENELKDPLGNSLIIRCAFSPNSPFSCYRISCDTVVDTKGNPKKLGGTLEALSHSDRTEGIMPELINQIPLSVIIFFYQEGNPIAFANDFFFSSFGYSRDSYFREFGNNGLGLLFDVDLANLYDILSKNIEKHENLIEMDLRLEHKDRGYVLFSAIFIITYDYESPLVHMYVKNEKKEQDIAIMTILKNLHDLVEDFPQSIGIFALHENIVELMFANKVLADLLGYKVQELQELEETEPLSIIFFEDIQYFKKSILQAKWPESPSSIRMRVVKKDGKVVNTNLIFKYFERSEKSIYFYIVFNEAPSVSQMEEQRVQAIEKLEYSLSHCLLTGLYTRQRFFDETKRMFENNPGRQFVMVCWNIERFAVINELFGLEIGNLVLKTVGSAIRDYCISPRTFSRLDADHFAACLPSELCNPVDIQRSINLDTLMKELNFSISLVFGLYRIEDTTMLIPLMCDRANLAMKSTRRNYMKNYEYYHELLSSKRIDEQTIINEMRAALQKGEFCFYLQPIYSLENGKISSAEALVRWNHPEKGILNPLEFIPVFEKYGFITTMDLYIWDMVCKYIAGELEVGHAIVPISVNFSRMDLYDRNLSSLLIATSEKYQVPPHLLELEVTETAYMDNPDQMRILVGTLQKYGFTILMDDFGTGYSSLNMLNSIPMDILKVDQNFLHSLGHDERASKILETIISLGKALRFPVIAEGVETKEQLEYLKHIGCGHVQGFYYSKPLTTKAFRILLDS
ncbi:EAL domain-containing protein [uncultured Sphaerochaeta sp.]|uniref:EAL domain-containing protein n=1 Tax=uncultured Sphaerochaeta sp. TaxID=886478 RepID=UPI002A0A70A8|nr:EAL domain-containing protein [uncultured Sphaerochaeta sp.]